MKYLLLALLFICSTAYANVYVISAADGSVYTMSEKDDTLVPAGYTKSVIQGKTLAQLNLTMSPDVYVLKGNTLSADGKKVADKRKSDEDALVAIEDQKAKKISAINKLKALGLTDDEVASLTGGN